MSLRPSDIPRATIRAIERGERETANLAEALAVDCRKLARLVAPDLSRAHLAQLSPDQPFMKRTKAAGAVLAEHLGPEAYDILRRHPSDIVRGWAAFSLTNGEAPTLSKLLTRIKPLADDPHFGVRECAWMGVRPFLIAELDRAITLLARWTTARSANIRRFATEATRPRGVWCSHIVELKADPARGLRLLEPLKADPQKYVQDSVANWLNDAAKDRPDWVIELTDAWLDKRDDPATRRIVTRARRSIAID
ncbi:MAG: DNA alkylation repair protein [Planctomycetota bacterium]